MRGMLKMFICSGILILPGQGFAIGLEKHKNEKWQQQWRYKIFTAEHQSIEKGGSKVIKSIFKIDLETGKVWRYRQGIDQEGKKYEEFFEVPEQ